MIPIAGWVAPFGYPRIKACSRLPMAFRSVPRPSSPPGAKASTECPSFARDHSPCTETILRIRRQASAASCQRQPKTNSQRRDQKQIRTQSFAQHTTVASERSCRNGGTDHPKQGTDHPVRLAITARPETHQNLIHPNKERADQQRTGHVSP